LAPPRKRSRTPSSSAGWITVIQAAKLAGLSHFTLYKMKSTGKIPAKMKKIGGVMHFNRSDFASWLKSRKKGPKAATRTRGRRRAARRFTARRRAARAPRRSAATLGARGSAFTLPTNGTTNLDFWFRILRFVRSRSGRVTIKTDGTKATLVAG